MLLLDREAAVIRCEIPDARGELHPYTIRPVLAAFQSVVFAWRLQRLDSRAEYHVILDVRGIMQCSCGDAKFRNGGRNCKHIRAVRLFAAAPPETFFTRKDLPVSEANITPATPDGAIEAALVRGDLSGLSVPERMAYVAKLCESLGLNPLTAPFRYLTLGGRLVLYATKDCTEQLRKIHNITLKVVEQKLYDDLLVVHVRATMKSGKVVREDEDFGAVSLAGLKGEARANGIMKAVTKAKRRATLSICGLGFLDETEAQDVAALETSGPLERLAPQPPGAPDEPALLRRDIMNQIDALIEDLNISRAEFDGRLSDAFGHAEPARLSLEDLMKILRGLQARWQRESVA